MPLLAFSFCLPGPILFDCVCVCFLLIESHFVRTDTQHAANGFLFFLAVTALTENALKMFGLSYAFKHCYLLVFPSNQLKVHLNKNEKYGKKIETLFLYPVI